MRAVLMARLLGARVRLKSGSGQEALGEALQAADPGVVATPFSSGDPAALDAHLREVDAVVVLGDDTTLDAIRAVTPDGCTFVGYGHRVSAAWLDRADRETARSLALDLCAWDQSGCLSPHVAWVSGAPERFLPLLAEAVRAVESSLPMELPEAARHSRAVARTTGQMLGDIEETQSALVCALPSGPFRSSPGFRTLWLLPMDSAGPLGLGSRLSSLACTSLPPAGLHPGVRLCAPGELQRPPLGWPHDGRPNLLPMLREI